MSTRLALIFPTFNMRRSDPGLEGLAGLDRELDRFTRRAAAIVRVSEQTFAYPVRGATPAGLSDVRQAHYASYIVGVATAAWVEERCGRGVVAAGYSMGMFAALCHAGAYDFEDGLALMDAVCVAVHDAVAKDSYAVAAIDGLSADRVQAVITGYPGVELIDVYGNSTTVVSGRADDVGLVLVEAERQGATYTKLTPATAPYHCSVLSTVEPAVRAEMSGMVLAAPRVPVISALTQELLATADAVKDEIASNVSRPMHWLRTMRTMGAMGISTVCECGSSDALSNMLRRDMPGAYDVRSLRSLT